MDAPQIIMLALMGQSGGKHEGELPLWRRIGMVLTAAAFAAILCFAVYELCWAI